MFNDYDDDIEISEEDYYSERLAKNQHLLTFEGLTFEEISKLLEEPVVFDESDKPDKNKDDKKENNAGHIVKKDRSDSSEGKAEEMKLILEFSDKNQTENSKAEQEVKEVKHILSGMLQDYMRKSE